MNAFFWNSEDDKIVENVESVRPKSLAMVEINNELFNKIKNTKLFAYSFYYPD